jgi:ribosome-associated protein
MNELDDDSGYSRPSKSALKRESQALEELGQQLVALPAEQLAGIPLPDELAEAIHTARRISSFSALKRQRKFIAKLLRETDVEPIHARLEGLNRSSAQSIHRHHTVERWRDRMLEGDDGVVDEFLQSHPGADRQKLRQLVRDARKEQQAAAAPRSARLLFRYLRQVLEEGRGTEVEMD